MGETPRRFLRVMERSGRGEKRVGMGRGLSVKRFDEDLGQENGRFAGDSLMIGRGADEREVSGRTTVGLYHYLAKSIWRLPTPPEAAWASKEV